MSILKSYLSILIIPFLVSCSTGNDTKMYDLRINIEPQNTGTISPSTDTTFEQGSLIKLRATASENYNFSNWSGDIDTSRNPINITIDQNLNLTANFSPKNYTLTTETLGDGIISEKIVKNKTDEYPFGTLVQLTAQADAGWNFSNWGGDISGTDTIKTLEINEPKSVTAKFNWFLNSIDSGDDEFIRSSLILDDGKVLITGKFNHFANDFEGVEHSDEYDPFLMKLNESEIEWVISFGGADNDAGVDVVKANDGGYIWTGYVIQWDAEYQMHDVGYREVFIIKVSKEGEIEWVNSLGGEDVRVSDIEPIPAGGYILTGDFNGGTGDFEGLSKGESDDYDIFVAKIDNNGNIVFIKSFGSSIGNSAYSIAVTGDGGFVFNGGNSSSSTMDEAFITKLSLNGETEWSKTYKSSDYIPNARVVRYDESNNSIFVLYKADDIGIIKYDLTGNIIWEKHIGSGLDIGFDIKIIENGDILITGSVGSFDGDFAGIHTGNGDVFLANLSASGNLNWVKGYGGFGKEMGITINLFNNEIIIAGNFDTRTYNFENVTSNSNDIFLLRLNDSGEILK